MTSVSPWKRLTAEGVVVVVSILMAFAIDASWDHRQERVLQRELLTSLRAAVESNSRLAASSAEAALGDRVLLQRFIGMTPSEAAMIAEDSTWVFFRAIWRPNAMALNTPEVVAILDENPGLLRGEPEIRAAIAEWRSRAAALDRQQQQLSDTYAAALEALGGYAELQPALAQLPGARVIPGEVAARVRQDTDVMGLAARKAFHSQIQIMFLEEVRGAADRVALLLRSHRAY